ncbi:uncharacterized protein TRAVEDRAFT_141857 [Trametes versicolor FP-101664 SS1]|uniref:uncharacterized protein n=1 Tax=Trametes versicolor (strain FP-101664) TaxID=717944 RepID=UPI0004623FBB|nr:uncharacterized protein TRAVEDRAFT_141857 [Trametes versicolor FP-101664 SS1]EIW63163.1 hypothetical protein TRAVEDRAFT_141857 [Trametes versicolor FP-101664 SS1]
MVGLARTRTLRDVALIFLGAAAMHFTTSFVGPLTDHTSSIVVKTQVSSEYDTDQHNIFAAPPAQHDAHKQLHVDHVPAPVLQEHREPAQEPIKSPATVDTSYTIPETTILSHAPGWTVFRNIYMSNGTMYIVTSRPSSFPDITMMTSTGLAAENTPENIAARMPTAEDMAFITPQEAQDYWGGDGSHEKNRIWSAPGNSFIINEPSQFLDHYYHFCAEWLFGAWAFWQGAWNANVDPQNAALTSAPPVHRAIFANAGAHGWRDRPGFNSYVFRSAFPALTVEVLEDWEDRIIATSSPTAPRRAWHFDTVLFSDRSASFRGPICGSQTQRIAAEATEHMRKAGNLTKLWWEPVRRAVLRFAGVDERIQNVGVRADTYMAGRTGLLAGQAEGTGTRATSGMRDSEVVITYISRQASRRHLLDPDHTALVAALEEMVKKHGWELNVVQAEKLSKEQQLAIAARTTVMLGVHGNGLTHLIMMPVTPVSTVIEIFYPGGFAHDYHWTAHALGMRHFAIWNDTYHTYPNEPQVNYPEGFQGTEIPVYPPTVVKVIEDRIAGLHPL